MILTNHYNLPDVFYQAIAKNIQRPQPEIMRVTQLISPPLMRQLTIKYWDKLKVDCSENLWSLLGTSVHAELAKITNNALIEKKITKTVFGIILSGSLDRFEKDTQTIVDFKVSSVWSYLLGVKEDWQKQLNVYKFLLESEGHFVKHLKIYLIIRDFQKGKAVQADYPKIPFVVLDVPVWNNEKISSYIKERVAVHKAEPLPCTLEERWERAPTFAIMKTGRKSAVRVKDTREEAEIYLNTKVKPTDKPKCEIVERKGEAIRCKNYCLVRDVCKYNPYNEEK